MHGMTSSAGDRWAPSSTREEREARPRSGLLSLSYAEMHRDKWYIHIPDSIADASLLQAATTLSISVRFNLNVYL